MHVIQKFFGPNYFFSSALKVPPIDSIQNMSQAPSICLKQQKRIIAFEKFFLFLVEGLKAKLESAYSFMLKHSKITVCCVSYLFISFIVTKNNLV